MPQEKLPIFLSRLFLNNAIMNSTEFSCKASNNEEDESEDHISLQVFGIISLVMLKKKEDLKFIFLELICRL